MHPNSWLIGFEAAARAGKIVISFCTLQAGGVWLCHKTEQDTGTTMVKGYGSIGGYAKVLIKWWSTGCYRLVIFCWVDSVSAGQAGKT